MRAVSTAPTAGPARTTRTELGRNRRDVTGKTGDVQVAPGHVLVTCWSRLGHVLVTSWSRLGHVLVTSCRFQEIDQDVTTT